MEPETIFGTKDYEEYLDKKVVLLLWEGKYLYGTLRSFDQYNSLTLEDTIERIFYGNQYAERKQGTYIVRGENVVILGCTKINFNALNKVEYNILKERIKMKGEVVTLEKN